MKLSSLFYAGSIVGLFGLAPSAQAAPITYQLSSMASGEIGPSHTPFTNVLVTLTATGDTANVVYLTDPNILFAVGAIPFSTFTVTIPSIGTATITDPSGIWAIPGLVPGFNPLPLVVFGRTDAPPSMGSFTGIGFFFTAALAGYDGTTAFGPMAGFSAINFNPACSTPNNDPCLHTSMGLLRFTTDEQEVVEGSFVASVAPTPMPEPATLVLLGSGVAALAGRSRVRTRKSGEDSRQV